jgi:glycosyltransferase involved in cell wall biosynthesis
MPAPADPDIAAVIPAYQAAATVADVVGRVRAAVPSARSYVIDDGSRDGTAAAARGAGAVVLSHPDNRGKGAALQTGVDEAMNGGVDLVVTLDADGQHPPESIPALLAPLGQGRADLVLGARDRSGPMPVPRRVSNWLSSAVTSLLGGHRITDAQTGFRAFRAGLARAVRPPESRYDYEAAFLLGALAGGWRVTSVPVPTIYAGAPSHFGLWSDTVRLARVYARFGLRRIFGAS